MRNFLLALLCLGLATLAVCGVVLLNDKMNQDWENRNRDPRAGRVLLTPNESEWKVCDGSTLTYWSYKYGVTSTVPNAAECAR